MHVQYILLGLLVGKASLVKSFVPGCVRNPKTEHSKAHLAQINKPVLEYNFARLQPEVLRLGKLTLS
eukprot:4913252-Amphidinium_carterae.1